MCLAQGPQRSDAGEARSRGPSVSSQALYHWATALLINIFYICRISYMHLFFLESVYISSWQVFPKAIVLVTGTTQFRPGQMLFGHDTKKTPNKTLSLSDLYHLKMTSANKSSVTSLLNVSVDAKQCRPRWDFSCLCLHCLLKRLLQHFKMSFVVIGTFNP